MNKLIAASFIALFALVSFGNVAPAKSSATTQITQIKVVESHDSKYRLFHGAIWLEHDKATHNYRWGGAHCANNGLSDINVSLLFAAFRYRYDVTIDYKLNKYKKYTYRCITGFTVTRRAP
jgi:hypothetical protein